MNQYFKISVLSLMLILISCNEKEYREELKFVNSILENPENIQNIIETSPFYDSTYFNLHGHTYGYIIKNLTSEENCKVEINGYGKPKIPLYNRENMKEYIMISDAKVIGVKKECLPYIIYFIFRDLSGKSILIGINVLII